MKHLKSKRFKKLVKLVKSRPAIPFVLGFVLVGAVTLLIVRAAPFVANFEAESATRQGVSLISSNLASNNQAIQFSSGQTTEPPEGIVCEMHLHWFGGGNGVGPGVARADVNNGQKVNFWPRSPYESYWNYDGPLGPFYDPGSTTDEQAYQNLVNYLQGHIDQRGCGPTVVAGYSNGGGLAAKLYCRGEDFGDRVFAYVVDDPVMDHGVNNCQPAASVTKVFFNHSSELINQAAASASAGYACHYTTTWYCEDDRTMTLEQYEQNIGVESVWQRTLHSNSPDGAYELTATHIAGTWADNYPN